MDRSKVEEIFEKVFELTSQKKLKWKVSAMDNSIFEVALSSLKVLVRGSGYSYSFLIENSQGLIIAQLQKENNSYIINSEYTFLPLEDLWDMAKSSALNIDEDLNSLLNNLNEL